MATNRIIEGGLRVNDSKQANKNNEPLISVLTVSYNAEKHIENCIKSVIAQPFKNIEHIIIDGNSQDSTISIIQKYNQQITYWRSENDSGIYNAMNKAVGFARGKWLIFLGSDDELLSGFSEMIPYLEDNQSIYYGDYLSDKQRYGGKFTSYRLSKSGICQQNILYSRSVFEKYQFQEQYLSSADYFLNIQCWADKQFQWKYIPIIMANFSSEGFSGRFIDSEFESDRIGIIKKYLGFWIYLRYELKQFRKKLKLK
ncbi:MAG: glycosyltransferase [Pyrinomonadaceae bacterium]|nr:glycosyltransferase [Sphingobacteriaceae bacterium]